MKTNSFILIEQNFSLCLLDLIILPVYTVSIINRNMLLPSKWTNPSSYLHSTEGRVGITANKQADPMIPVATSCVPFSRTGQ